MRRKNPRHSELTPAAQAGVCALCERSVGAVTRHHVVPRSEGGRDTVWLCRACHLQLHACFTNETLAAELGSLERLRSDPVVERYLHWIRRQQDGRVRVRRSRHRR